MTNIPEENIFGQRHLSHGGEKVCLSFAEMHFLFLLAISQPSLLWINTIAFSVLIQVMLNRSTLWFIVMGVLKMLQCHFYSLMGGEMSAFSTSIQFFTLTMAWHLLPPPPCIKHKTCHFLLFTGENPGEGWCLWGCFVLLFFTAK